MDGQTTLDLDLERVTHQNSLRVINAERFVYSSNDDFDQLREMLNRHPELMRGMRYS